MTNAFCACQRKIEWFIESEYQRMILFASHQCQAKPLANHSFDYRITKCTTIRSTLCCQSVCRFSVGRRMCQCKVVPHAFRPAHATRSCCIYTYYFCFLFWLQSSSHTTQQTLCRDRRLRAEHMIFVNSVLLSLTLAVLVRMAKWICNKKAAIFFCRHSIFIVVSRADSSRSAKKCKQIFIQTHGQPSRQTKSNLYRIGNIWGEFAAGTDFAVRRFDRCEWREIRSHIRYWLFHVFRRHFFVRNVAINFGNS